MNSHEKLLYKNFLEELEETEKRDYENRFEIVRYVLFTQTLVPKILEDHEISTRISTLVDSLNITSKSLERLRKIVEKNNNTSNMELLEKFYGHLQYIDDVSIHQDKYIELLVGYDFMKLYGFGEDYLQENYREASETREIINNGIKKLVRTSKNDLQKK